MGRSPSALFRIHNLPESRDVHNYVQVVRRGARPRISLADYIARKLNGPLKTATLLLRLSDSAYSPYKPSVEQT